VIGLLPLPVDPDRDRLAGMDWRMKLTPDEARELKEMAIAGHLSQRKLAALFGVHQTNVSSIKRGLTWRSLKEE
jgi:hypothetical protein